MADLQAVDILHDLVDQMIPQEEYIEPRKERSAKMYTLQHVGLIILCPQHLDIIQIFPNRTAKNLCIRSRGLDPVEYQDAEIPVPTARIPAVGIKGAVLRYADGRLCHV